MHPDKNSPAYKAAKAAASHVPVALPLAHLLDGAAQMAKQIGGIAAMLEGHPLGDKFTELDKSFSEFVRNDLSDAVLSLGGEPCNPSLTFADILKEANNASSS